MLTERGKPDYDLPEDFGEVVHLYLIEGPYFIRLMLAPIERLEELRREDRSLGKPTMAAVDNGVHRRLWFHPTPDDAFAIEAIYAPAFKQF